MHTLAVLYHFNDVAFDDKSCAFKKNGDAVNV